MSDYSVNPYREHKQDLRERIKTQLEPLHAELASLDAQRERLKAQIAELDEQANMIRKVLRPVFEELAPAKRQPVTTATIKRTNGDKRISPETVELLLEGARVLGVDDSEFTTRQLAEYAQRDKSAVAEGLEELREQGAVRLSSVRVVDGQKAGRKSKHYRVIES